MHMITVLAGFGWHWLDHFSFFLAQMDYHKGCSSPFVGVIRFLLKYCIYCASTPSRLGNLPTL